MQAQKIKRFVDAMGGQGRLILNLDCGHNLSFTATELAHDPALNQVLRLAKRWECPHCPDPPPDPPPAPQNPWGDFG